MPRLKKLNFSVVPNPWIGTVYTASHLESWKSSILPFPYLFSNQVLKILSHHSFLPQLCHISDPHHSSSGQFQGSSKIPCLQSHCSLLGLHNAIRTIQILSPRMNEIRASWQEKWQGVLHALPWSTDFIHPGGKYLYSSDCIVKTE